MRSSAAAASTTARRHGLRYELERMVQEVRIADLRERLAAGEVTVRRTTRRRAGSRVGLELDDSSTLALRLFWPRRDVVTALVSLRYDDRVGWIAVARTAIGAEVILYAWLATITPADGR
jgi:hypothetical protein